ncbi:rhomboid family intramembrane serine protease [Pedobacter caeni]|nr:rhomboid family intramembrane serine protease [Pedobacter caeni]
MGKFVQELQTDGLTNKQTLVIAFETVNELGWRIRFTSDAGVIAYTENGEYSWNGEVTVKLLEGVISVQCVTISNLTVDYGKCEQAVVQYHAAFEKMKTALTDDEIQQKYKRYKKDFIPPYEDTLKPDTRPKFHLFNGFQSYFVPANAYFVTPILVGSNIIIFIMMVCTGVSFFEPDAQSMIAWGANSTIATLDGQWWRLLSNCFLHFGFIHLLLNMYALFYVGFLLEPFLGRSKFIIAYLLTGIAASALSLWWHDYTVSAGASGAIFGLYGVFIAILCTNHIEPSMRKGLLINIGIFVIYNLVYGNLKSGIDNAAHVGGLLSGLLIGFLYLPALKKADNRMLNQLTLSTIAIVTIACSAFGYISMSKSDRFVYQKQMQVFYAIETDALKVFKDFDDKPAEAQLSGLKTSIGDWSKGLELIKQSDKLTLPEKTHKKNALLIRYCRLRIQSYEMMSLDIQRGEHGEQERLQLINEQIKSVIKQLSKR